MHTILKANRNFADIGGSAMAYVDVGQGETVVLGHSYLWDAEMWAPQITALSERYRVIVPELWGHGQSSPLPAGTTNLRQISEHHLQLLDSLDIKQFALVGLSVGGMWATELALAAPDRIAGLCLIGTYAGAEPAPSRELYFSLLDTVGSIGAVPAGIIEKLLPLFFGPDALTQRPDLIEQFRSSLMGVDRRDLIDTLIPLGRMIFDRRDMLLELHRIGAPSLVITGEFDRSRPPAEGRHMAAALGAPFIELSGAGHIASLEKPAQLSGHLLSFLEGVFHPAADPSSAL